MVEVPYTLREFGELGVGEKHCILPNNVVQLAGSIANDDELEEKGGGSKEPPKNALSNEKQYRKIGDRYLNDNGISR